MSISNGGPLVIDGNNRTGHRSQEKVKKAKFFFVSRGLNSLQRCCKYRYCCSGHTSLRPHRRFAYVMHDLLKRMRQRCVPGSFFLLPLEPGYEANYTRSSFWKKGGGHLPLSTPSPPPRLCPCGMETYIHQQSSLG